MHFLRNYIINTAVPSGVLGAIVAYTNSIDDFSQPISILNGCLGTLAGTALGPIIAIPAITIMSGTSHTTRTYPNLAFLLTASLCSASFFLPPGISQVAQYTVIKIFHD